MNKRKIGSVYETKAADYLKQNGYEILEQNYRCRSGEIDLIGTNKGYLCFIEVKYRKDQRAGDPLEAVNLRKQKKICQTAQYYLHTHPEFFGVSCRFDVVGILADEFHLVQNAFWCD